jgi:hypothetical protein
MPGRFLRVAVGATCFLLIGCSQNGGPPNIITTQTMSPSAASSPSASPQPVTTPIPPNASRYDTPIDAGIAGIEAKTGLTYTGGSCGSSQSCLGAAQVFGNPADGAAAYVEITPTPAGSQTCFAYVYFAAGWHYVQPVVCPQQAGYNPVLGAQDHVVVPGTCANLRLAPSLSGKIVTCLKDGTLVLIDPDFPRYADGHIWWSVNGHQGWMAHDFLIRA